MYAIQRLSLFFEKVSLKVGLIVVSKLLASADADKNNKRE